MRFFFIFASLFLFGNNFADAEESRYTDELCEDYRKIAQEFIDAELAGIRWQGASSKTACLKKQRLQTMTPDRSPASDPAFLDPEFLLADHRNIDFSVRRLPNDLLEVVMSYIGSKNKKDIPVKDNFVLKLNFGRVREQRGCASYYTEPKSFVMRARCWKD